MDLNSQQLSILNALVTFSAEHIPGGLSEDEREVAQIVGGWALKGQSTVMTQPHLAHVRGLGGDAQVCHCQLGQNHI